MTYHSEVVFNPKVAAHYGPKSNVAYAALLAKLKALIAADRATGPPAHAPTEPKPKESK